MFNGSVSLMIQYFVTKCVATSTTTGAERHTGAVTCYQSGHLLPERSLVTGAVKGYCDFATERSRYWLPHDNTSDFLARYYSSRNIYRRKLADFDCCYKEVPPFRWRCLPNKQRLHSYFPCFSSTFWKYILFILLLVCQYFDTCRCLRCQTKSKIIGFRSNSEHFAHQNWTRSATRFLEW